MRDRIPLCQLDEIPDGGSRGLELQDEPLLAVRQGQQVFVYRNNCPHANLPLEWVPDQFLDSSGTLIHCANHGALFTIDTGECISGPCIGDALESLPCEVADGVVYACPGD